MHCHLIFFLSNPFREIKFSPISCCKRSLRNFSFSFVSTDVSALTSDPDLVVAVISVFGVLAFINICLEGQDGLPV